MSASRRRRASRIRRPPPGARPGALAVPDGALVPRLRVIDYATTHVEQQDPADPHALAPLLERESVTWVDVSGLGDERILRRIGDVFRIHPLALADVVNTPQRPKFESYDAHNLLVTRLAELDDDGDFHGEQLSIVFGRGFVVSFREGRHDCFEGVRARILGGAPIRGQGADFLAYALVDAVIDHYFPVLEALAERIDALEEEVMGSPGRLTLHHIQRVRRHLLRLHRVAWQQRDAVGAFLSDEQSHSSPAQRIYLRDAYDHAVQVIDAVESYREITVGLVDVYLSILSNRLNEIMKLLTMLSAIFIPITFLAGLYGMNFEHMPELRWRFGYPAVLVVMAGMVAGMLLFFRRRGWIGAADADPAAGAGDAPADGGPR